MGYCTSDWSLALGLGIILELLWLDVLELGSVVPPYSSLSLLLVFPLCRILGFHQPGALLLPLFLSMLAAYLAGYCERRHRIRLNSRVDALEAWCAGKPGGLSPGRVILAVIWRKAVWQALLYVASFSLIYALLQSLSARQALPHLPMVTWSALYLAALLGVLLSLRTRHAYMVLAGALGIVALRIWEGSWFGVQP